MLKTYNLDYICGDFILISPSANICCGAHRNLQQIQLVLLIRKFSREFYVGESNKRHISDVRHSQLGHDIHISVNDRVILPFCEGFIFANLRICEVSQTKALAKISEFTVYIIFLGEPA